MDGSLLDHYTYQFAEAIPALTALKQRRIPVIPITSKTQAELELLRQQLDVQHPFVVENGAAVFIPKAYFDSQPADTVESGQYWVKEFVERRATWQALIEQVGPRFCDQFVTFAQAGTDGIMTMTGLSHAQAVNAGRRQYGEPVSWLGDASLKRQFVDELTALGAALGVTVLEGGRFLHVSGPADKGLALQWLAQIYQAQIADKTVMTLALGDSDNDKAMLEVADCAVLVRSPVHEPPLIKRNDNLFVSTHTGPRGWTEGVLNYIDLAPAKR